MLPSHAAFWLVAAHFALDYPLQGDTTAIRKSRHCKLPDIGVPWPYWMTAHATMHGAGVLLILGSLPLALCETVAHFMIDMLKCERRIGIHTDQALHLGCKALWLALSLTWLHG